MRIVHVDSWRTTYRSIVPDEHLAKLSYADREEIWSRIVADPAQHTHVAEESGRIVGCSNGGKNRGDERDYAGELYSVYLLQTYQQQGVGRRLTLAIGKDLETSGIRSMIELCAYDK